MTAKFDATPEQVQVMGNIDFVFDKLTNETRYAVQDAAKDLAMPDGVSLIGVRKGRDGVISEVRDLFDSESGELIEYDFVVFQPTYVVKHTDYEDIEDLTALFTRVNMATEEVVDARKQAEKRVADAEAELRAAQDALELM